MVTGRLKYLSNEKKEGRKKLCHCFRGYFERRKVKTLLSPKKAKFKFEEVYRNFRRNYSPHCEKSLLKRFQTLN